MVEDMDRSSLMGREQHLGVLTDAISDARNGLARTVTVYGEAGSGKTALLDAVAAESQDSMRVLRVSGHLAESDLPLAGVHQLVRQTGLDDILSVGQDADPLRDAATLLAELTNLARDTPVLLVVDDAQWLDRLSHRALVFLARRIDADAVCVLFGVRSPHAAHLTVGTELEVGSLSEEDSLGLLRQAHPQMSARVATKITATAHGLPLALREIPADLSDAQRIGTEPLPGELPLGRSLTGLFTDRIGSLPDATRLCLLGAAFDNLTSETYASVLGDLGCTLDDLDAAERAGLARVRGGRCEFRHPLVTAAIRAEARSQELIAVHRALAGQFPDDPIRSAYHLRQDPQLTPDRLLPVLREGAEAAAATRSYDEAAELWTAAAEQAADPEGRRALLREAVRCLALAGSGPEAQALIEQLLAETTEPTERAHVLRDLTWVSLWTRSVAPDNDATVEAHSVELLDQAEPESHLLGRNLLAALATAMLGAGEYRRAQKVSMALATHAADQLTVEQTLLCDVIAVMAGEPDAGRLLRQGEAWIESYPWAHVLDPSTPAGFITVVLGWLGEYATLDQVIAHCRRATDEHGPSASGMYIANSMTTSRERHHGRWDRALLEFETLEQIVIDTDFAAPYPFIALRHAHLLAAQGDVEGCELLRQRARERAPEWVPILSHLDHAVAGLLALSARDFATALEHLDHAARIEQDVGLVTSGYLSRAADTFEAAWRLGEAESRLAELTAFEDAMRAVHHRTMMGLAARCRALVAAPEEMDAAFAYAAELLGKEPDGFEAARTHLLWGERLRRARRKADAHHKLTLAQETFTRLGAKAWAEQCASELAACGIRRVNAAEATDGPVSQLTPREFEVAREVATGMSNADAARRLFISERTVEFHLYNAFRKLGIETREALQMILNP